jgi:release factor glutamine methyltransferase
MSEPRPGERLWTVRDLLKWTAERFARAGLASPRLDAEVLLAHALRCDRVALYVDLDRPLHDDERAPFRELVRRRLAREPVAYLVGAREFWSRPFRVDGRVLVPRPETETLVEHALALLPEGAPRRVWDVGTGSGCIAITLKLERPACEVLASDASAAALAVARENAAALGADVAFHEGDLLAALPADAPPVDLIVANLPYVAEADRPALAPELGFEPAVALYAADDGLALIARLAREAPARLVRPRGVLLLEIGASQAQAVEGRLAAAGFAGTIATRKDLAGQDRCVVARLAPDPGGG